MEMSKRERQQIGTEARRMAREYRDMQKNGVRPAIADVYGDIINDDEALIGWINDEGTERIPESVERKQERARLFSSDIKMEWFNAMTGEVRKIIGR